MTQCITHSPLLNDNSAILTRKHILTCSSRNQSLFRTWVLLLFCFVEFSLCSELMFSWSKASCLCAPVRIMLASAAPANTLIQTDKINTTVVSALLHLDFRGVGNSVIVAELAAQLDRDLSVTARDTTHFRFCALLVQQRGDDFISVCGHFFVAFI